MSSKNKDSQTQRKNPKEIFIELMLMMIMQKNRLPR